MLAVTRAIALAGLEHGCVSNKWVVKIGREWRWVVRASFAYHNSKAVFLIQYQLSPGLLRHFVQPLSISKTETTQVLP